MLLWRNTLQLFHQYRRPHFIGPFKAAGFTHYIVERSCMTKGGKENKPDIVASSDDGWAVLELTTQLGSKNIALGSYLSIDPRNLGRYGLISHRGPPDVLSSRLLSVDDGQYCQLIVEDHLEVEKENYINNPKLREALIDSKGTDLRRLPEIPITLLPEMKGQEIRRGLIDIVMQIFDPNCDGKELIKLVHVGLERLSSLVGVPEETGLKKKVKDEMDVLIQDFLNDYLEFDKENETYRATEKFKPHPKTMEHITIKLMDWAGYGPQKTLQDFPEKTPFIE